MPYTIPTVIAQANLEIKKSQFFGFGYPFTTREQLTLYIKQLREQYPDARHICYGYIIGDPHNTTSAGFDDDGEPSGTAGKPILNVLQHKAIGNCLIAVVRYFGGIKLGAGGLTQAYSATAQAVVNNMTLAPFVAMASLRVSTEFANESQIRHFAKVYHATIETTVYQGVEVTLVMTIAADSLIDFKHSIGQIATVQH